jgi:predicted SAM-dependent methyltransferase
MRTATLLFRFARVRVCSGAKGHLRILAVNLSCAECGIQRRAVEPAFGGSMTFRAWVRIHVYAKLKYVIASREISRYIGTNDQPKLNLGAAGNCVPGWLNVDLHPNFRATHLDATRRWPFEDDTFYAMLCEHMIEHVTKENGKHILAEAFRTLKPGKYFRVITPDLNWFASRIIAPGDDNEIRYLGFLDHFFERSGTTWCDAINLTFYEHGHRYIWSSEELSEELTRAGFVDLVLGRATEWTQTVFKDVEGHTKISGDLNAVEAFAIEARKP